MSTVQEGESLFLSLSFHPGRKVNLKARNRDSYCCEKPDASFRGSGSALVFCSLLLNGYLLSQGKLCIYPWDIKLFIG